MKINVINAANLFFPTPSLELVLFEAIANSIDAEASKIEIVINVDSFAKPETLSFIIKDNGFGFVDENFRKFSNLLEVEEEDHKGIGRLVFLKYFKSVNVVSYYDKKKRTFSFHGKFDGENKLNETKEEGQGTILTFENYFKNKIKSYDYIKPRALKKSILFHFFPLFYAKKIKNENLIITIRLQTKDPNMDYGFFNDTSTLDISKIPNLEEITFNEQSLDFFQDLHIYYSVKENLEEESLITAISVDGRTIPVNILSKENIPRGYEIVFLLFSDYFTGKVNTSRQELTLGKGELRTVTKIFQDKIGEILNKKIPFIQKRNTEINKGLNDRFPHLQGYFDENSVGIIDRSKSLEIAQSKFFQEQKQVLDSSSLSEELYQKSLEISSRLLMEYILYRNIIINKLKEIDSTNSEDDMHNIIIPMRKTYKKSNFINDLYTNNAWLLDDKYMSYNTILSDKEMDKLIDEITFEEEEIEKDIKRPDIAIVFSGNPDKTEKVDVVIIELKKLGLDLAKKENVVSQLKQRARKLLQYYPDKIQRIWFYGIVDIDEEFEISLLEEKFANLYSTDKVYYKEHSVILDYETKKEIPVGLFVLSFDAFLKDAETRNATFLNLLKESFKNERSKVKKS
jgi:hypothetical protein